MTIRTLHSHTKGDRSIASVLITERSGEKSVAWEFTCDACDTMDTGLSESVAQDEFDNHLCPNA